MLEIKVSSTSKIHASIPSSPILTQPGVDAQSLNAAIRFASTSVAKRSSGGFFSWLTGGRSNQLPPLDFPLPGVMLPPPLPDYVEPAKTRITTLANGVKIASETSPLEKMKAELGEISSNPQGLLLEAIHSAGYSGALANPLIAPESAINKLNSTILEEFVAENYTASRIVLAASGVEHDELVSIAEPLLSDLPNVSQCEEPKSAYVGGEYRCQADSSKTHVALAFEVPGGWRKEKDAMTLTVLQMLMGGGGSFSAGGPGKGMFSRLYLRVLNEFPQIQAFSAFNSIYNDTGVFGIHATTGSEFAPKAVDLAARELLSIATPGQVDQAQLDRAKESAKSAVLMYLESRIVASEDIGRQVLTYGERKPVEHFLKAIDGVTLKDMTSLAEKIISLPLTMASWGDVIHVPSYESVSRKFLAK
ncbi:Mitochondrial-processing peptidase subunit alpha [Ananas comosus]|uniref:Mitochondrial-processing peptidase subunit alpha n=1 Tax=Ananas comosus TaxID=4615 RepID=A0A199W4J6_ANACO|nr:Mitochondrial-processing peptidase subunit alpha [Ananas comosus]